MGSDLTTAMSEVNDIGAALKARIERNRQRALLLRSARIASHPYAKEACVVRAESLSGSSRAIDSGAGFFIEPEEDKVDSVPLTLNSEDDTAPIIDGSEGVCRVCLARFSDSYFIKHFDEPICDGCRRLGTRFWASLRRKMYNRISSALRDKDKDLLITKTDAKQLYCLKDCDLDLREPALKFVVKKNPHNDRWGDMKLYFKEHVRKRAIQIWGGEDRIETEKESREEKKEKLKQKKFTRKINDLRRAVRTSIWHKDLSKHVHEYDPDTETYDEQADTYSKRCKSCDHVLTYEKM